MIRAATAAARPTKGEPMSEPIRPYVPAEKNLPEFTAQTVLLGLVLSLIMCAANIYVGLYAGMTVSDQAMQTMEAGVGSCRP